jgi:prevent-host-death family protein
MNSADREIPQRELRNDVARVLKEVSEGARVRVTVRGQPVAELVPFVSARQFVPRAEYETILVESPLDPGFDKDLEAALGATIEEL